jgi:acyl carrier protein
MIELELIKKRLITIVAKSLEIPEKTVLLESSLMNDLGAESIDIMDIRFAIEQQFGFKFNFEEIRSLLANVVTERKLTEKDIPSKFTVGSLMDYIVYKLAAKDAAQ